MHSTAPFDSLYLSPLNVRKTGGDIDIDILAADIAAKGLKQNLDVVEGDLAGMFGITDGGRRWRALKLLDDKGEWPHEFVDREAIPIKIEPYELGRETSLTANLQRVPMNPADEVVAFAAIIADYAALGEQDPQVRIARCALHFGYEVRYIEQRLRLAELAPDILEALRVGTINLASAQAYAAVSDHALQMQVFGAQESMGLGAHNRHSPNAIRAAFAGKIYKLGDRQVRYVGLDAYREAGGRVELDLFMASADEEVLIDTALVDRLCIEKAEREAAGNAAEDGFQGGVVAPWAGSTYSWPKTPVGGFERALNGPPTPELRSSAIAIYRIAADGGRLELTPDYFRKTAAAAQPGETPAASRPARFESEIDRLSRIRRERIFARAARLAAPSTSGTPLHGRAYWPPAHDTSVQAIAEDGDGNLIVAMLVVVPRADVDQLMGAAERLVDLEEAELDRARSADPPPADVAAAAPADAAVTLEPVE